MDPDFETRILHPRPEQQQYEPLPSWKHLTTTHKCFTSTCEHCPERSYASLQIPNDGPGKRTLVRRVVFTTISRDQGYASLSPDLIGTYSDAHAYFEASVVDCNGQDRINREILHHAIRGTPRFVRHVVCWDYRDDALYWPDMRDPHHGRSGMVFSRWLSAIRGGDAIQIVPRADHLAWINYTGEASIEAWVETIDVDPSQEMRFSQETYKLYRPLETERKEIRLVVIAPRAANPNDDLPHLSVDYTTLTDPRHIRFEALSYTWGDMTDSEPIVITNDEQTDSVKVMISGNLQRALLRLRHDEIPRVFWVDLLCINQTNKKERAEQVALMGEIYSAAEAVRVWLGELEDKDSAREDFEVLSRIARKYDTGKGKEEQSLEPGDTHDGFFENGKYSANLYFPDRPFLRLWFQRVWVLQEVWSASSAIVAGQEGRQHPVSVICGDIELPWWVIMQANRCLYNLNRQRRGNLMPSPWTELFDVSAKRHCPQLVGRPGPQRDIAGVVICGLDMRAMDPRDRIFALLAFGRETHDIAQLSDLVRPDYTKSTAEVYADFTIWYIREHKSLKILSAVHTLRGRTWVDLESHLGPKEDHNDRPSWTLWCNGDSSWAHTTLGLIEPVEYRACGDRTIDLELLTSSPSTTISLSQWHIPALKGIRISTVASLGVFPLPRQHNDSAMLAAYFHIFDPAGHQWQWRNFTHEPLGAAGGHSSCPHNLMRAHLHHVRSHYAVLQDAKEDFLPCHDRPLFTTEAGQRGFCPPCARVGDVVVILYGGLVPYILRARDDGETWTFVGECYLDGFMHGEAFDERSGDFSAKEEVFRLI